MTRGDAALSDAQLVPRVVAGDREAFAQVYERYADRLYDFAHSMLRQREEAADAVADSFVSMAEKLGQLRNPDRLRPWLYSVVRRECLRRLRERAKLSYNAEEQLVSMADDSSTPGERAEQEELRTLVWDAAAGLGERDRALLDLHLRHGLEGAELGEAMGVTANNAYVMLNRLRAQVERSLGALLIARLGRDDCTELAAILRDWDGKFSPLVRKRVARHIDACDVCDRRRSTIASPSALYSGVALLAAPATLRSRVLDDPRLVAYGLGPSGPRPPVGPGAPPPDAADRRRSLVRGVTAAVLAALLALLIILAVVGLPEGSGRPPIQPLSTSSKTPPLEPSQNPTFVPRTTPTRVVVPATPVETRVPTGVPTTDPPASDPTRESPTSPPTSGPTRVPPTTERPTSAPTSPETIGIQ